jgi:site-specific recombinase XerD
LVPGGLDPLIEAWSLSLRSERRAPATRRTYLAGARQLLDYLKAHGMPTVAEHVRREHVEAYLADVGERRSANTAQTRYRALQQFFRWLVEDGEIAESPMRNMKSPSVAVQPPPVFSEADLKALLATCRGSSFEDRRDLAILRVFIDTGMRLGEMTGLRVGDYDLGQELLWVRGKGDRLRACPIGVQTAHALDKYTRKARAKHPHRGADGLWLGPRGPIGHGGIAQMVQRRGFEAGLAKIHPHMFRHTFAHQWLSQNGTEGGLMQVAGWKSRDMLNRYGASAAAERARDEHRRLSPGDRI